MVSREGSQWEAVRFDLKRSLVQLELIRRILEDLLHAVLVGDTLLIKTLDAQFSSVLNRI